MIDITSEVKIIDFIFIKTTNLNEKVTDHLCKLLKIDCSNLLKIGINSLFYSKKLSIECIYDIIKILIEEKKFDFVIHLMSMDKSINVLKFKAIEIFYEEKVIFKNKSYKCLKDFLNSNIIFKLWFKDLKIKKNNSKKLIIIINNFNSLNISLSKVLNLITLFGGIKEINYDSYYGNIYLTFISIDTINKIINNKSVFKYKDKSIRLKLWKFKNIKSKTFIEKIKFNKKINTIDLKSINTNYIKPCSKCVVWNLNKSVSKFNFYKMISENSKPQLIKFQDNNKQCIILFENINECTNFIMDNNNKTLDSIKIKVSFTSSEQFKV